MRVHTVTIPGKRVKLCVSDNEFLIMNVDCAILKLYQKTEYNQNKRINLNLIRKCCEIRSDAKKV